MEIIIVSGLSGSGKSKGVAALEDIGFFCVDNMPPSFIVRFCNLCIEENMDKVAIVTDTRGGYLFNGLSETLERLRDEDVKFKLLFFECADDVLVNRFKETRRRHPLVDESNGSVSAAIVRERELLEPLREIADYIIDTTHIPAAKLKEIISEMFLGDSIMAMKIHCVSFGFKYGVPSEADMVFDVRCLPNPFYIDKLRPLCGKDESVFKYVMEKPESQEYVKRLFSLLDYLVPLYSDEGKSQLSIAFGCTGGKHRSVAFAELTASHFREQGMSITVLHRDFERYKK